MLKVKALVLLSFYWLQASLMADMLMSMNVENELPQQTFISNISNDIGVSIVSSEITKGQSFLLPQKAVLNGIVLKVHESEKFTELNLSIFKADSEGYPNSFPIYNGTVATPNSFQTKDYLQLNFSDIELEKGQYIFTLSATKGLISFVTNVNYENNSIFKRTSESSWEPSLNHNGETDLSFALMGTANFRQNFSQSTPIQRPTVKAQPVQQKSTPKLVVKSVQEKTIIDNLAPKSSPNAGTKSGKSLIEVDNEKAQIFKLNKSCKLSHLELITSGKKNDCSFSLSIMKVTPNGTLDNKSLFTKQFRINQSDVVKKSLQLTLPKVYLSPGVYAFVFKAKDGAMYIATNDDYEHGNILRNNLETEGWEETGQSTNDLRFLIKGYMN